MATFNGQDGRTWAQTGNTIKLLFDGKPLGVIRSLRAQDEYSPEPVSGIGDIHVLEYAPTMARHTLQVEHAILHAETLFSLGIMDENGCVKMAGREFDIEIFTKYATTTPAAGTSVTDALGCMTDGKLLRKYEGCSYAGGSINVQAHQIVMSDATFNARLVTGLMTS